MGKDVLEKGKKNVQLSICTCWELPPLLQITGFFHLYLHKTFHLFVLHTDLQEPVWLTDLAGNI